MRIPAIAAALVVATSLLAVESTPAGACWGWGYGGYGYTTPRSYGYYGYAPRYYRGYAYGPRWGWRGYGYRY
jgi:hypothetical protein